MAISSLKLKSPHSHKPMVENQNPATIGMTRAADYTARLTTPHMDFLNQATDTEHFAVTLRTAGRESLLMVEIFLIPNG